MQDKLDNILFRTYENYDRFKGGEQVYEDTLFLMDTIYAHISMMEIDMAGKILPEKFYKFSWYKFALEQLIDTIEKLVSSTIVTPDVIRTICQNESTKYHSWYKTNKSKQQRYYYAREMILEIEKMVSAFCVDGENDERYEYMEAQYEYTSINQES